MTTNETKIILEMEIKLPKILPHLHVSFLDGFLFDPLNISNLPRLKVIWNSESSPSSSSLCYLNFVSHLCYVNLPVRWPQWGEGGGQKWGAKKKTMVLYLVWSSLDVQWMEEGERWSQPHSSSSSSSSLRGAQSWRQQRRLHKKEEFPERVAVALP